MERKAKMKLSDACLDRPIVDLMDPELRSIINPGPGSHLNGSETEVEISVRLNGA